MWEPFLAYLPCIVGQSANTVLSGSPPACGKLGTHHSLIAVSRDVVIKPALPGVNMVPSVLKGAEGA